MVCNLSADCLQGDGLCNRQTALNTALSTADCCLLRMRARLRQFTLNIASHYFREASAAFDILL